MQIDATRGNLILVRGGISRPPFFDQRREVRKIAGVITLIAAAVIAASFIASAHAQTGTAASVRVPRVSGLRLDTAEIRLLARGLRFREHGGGMFGILVKHNWQVCVALPGSGKRVARGTRVQLYVGRPGSC